MTIRRRCRGARALVRCLAAAALLAAAGCADSGAGPGSGPGGAGGGGSGGVGGGASGGDAAVQVTGGSGGGGIGGGGGGSVMSFFVTSTGSGPMGGDLGGLEGADAKCQQLAAAVGAGNKTWVAWLSVERGPAPGGAPVHAKDRVGPGPWHDAKGRLIAQSLADLLPGPELRPKGDPQAIADLVDEQGAPVSKSPLHHDVLTGTLATGLVAAGQTCGDWKSTTGTAQVGHSDNRGPFSWTESHLTMGCTMAGVAANGGNGRFYCFARR